MYLLLFLWPVFEIIAIGRAVSLVGGWAYFWYCVFSACVGLLTIGNQGRAAWFHAGLSLSRGKMPSDALANGLLGVAGGALLILPGVLSDVAGVLLLFPPTRALMKGWIMARMLERARRGGVFIFRKTTTRPPDPSRERDVIEIGKSPLPPGSTP